MQDTDKLREYLENQRGERDQNWVYLSTKFTVSKKE